MQVGGAGWWWAWAKVGRFTLRLKDLGRWLGGKSALRLGICVWSACNGWYWVGDEGGGLGLRGLVGGREGQGGGLWCRGLHLSD